MEKIKPAKKGSIKVSKRMPMKATKSKSTPTIGMNTQSNKTPPGKTVRM